MYLITIIVRIFHSIFSEVIPWTFPLKNFPSQSIIVLFLKCLLVFGYEEDNKIAIPWGHHTAGKRLIAPISP